MEIIIKLPLEYIWVCESVSGLCLFPSEFIPLGTKASRQS